MCYYEPFTSEGSVLCLTITVRNLHLYCIYICVVDISRSWVNYQLTEENTEGLNM